MPGLGERNRPATWDLVALGEVMLRLDPGEERIVTTRSFRVWEGGGEYNVARGLRRCFGLRTALLSAFADNAVGRLLEDLILQGSVDTSHVRWLPYDGVGRTARNGLNFTERGFGLRGALGCSDRGHTAASQMAPGDVDYGLVFGEQGAKWFHTGGIFAALSDTTALLAEEAMAAARQHGAVVSFDINYRPSLWSARGGNAAAIDVNRRLAALADVLVGNEEDFALGLGYEMAGGKDLSSVDPDSCANLILKVAGDYPGLRLVAASLRRVRSATVNDWSGICWADGKIFHATEMQGLEIMDRVGGGDAFASGLIYGSLTGLPVQETLQYGVAHGALAMTTPGDTSMATLAEVQKVVMGGSARVVR